MGFFFFLAIVNLHIFLTCARFGLFPIESISLQSRHSSKGTRQDAPQEPSLVGIGMARHRCPTKSRMATLCYSPVSRAGQNRLEQTNTRTHGTAIARPNVSYRLLPFVIHSSTAPNPTSFSSVVHSEPIPRAAGSIPKWSARPGKNTVRNSTANKQILGTQTMGIHTLYQ